MLYSPVAVTILDNIVLRIMLSTTSDEFLFTPLTDTQHLIRNTALCWQFTFTYSFHKCIYHPQLGTPSVAFFFQR